MRVLSIVCFVIAAILGIGGLIHASKPSVYPIVNVVGAFILPALFAWWGKILWDRSARRP